MITQARLKELFTYDAAEGQLRRIKGKRHRDLGSSRRQRRYVDIDGVRYTHGHLVWLWHHGEMPAFEIDHRDCDELNDRIENLRPATRAQNLANMRNRPSNTSGFKGVSWDKSRGKWLASISIGNRFKNLGRYDDPAAAHAAYQQAAKERHGEFARFA